MARGASLTSALWGVACLQLTWCHCSFPRCAVDLPFPENSTHPVLRDGPNAVALYRGNTSSFALGKVMPAAGLLDAFVYTNSEGASPELLEALTLGRPALESTR